MTLTNNDFKNIRELFQEILNQTLNLELGQTLDNKLDEKIGHLPTKDEFYAENAKLMAKLNEIEESQDILTHRVYENHEPRIKKLERKVGVVL